MRQLDQDEREWIGAILLMAFIVFIPFSLMMDLTKQPLDDWGKQIADTKDIPTSILWLVIYYGRIIGVIFTISPVVKLVNVLGFNTSMMPKRWEIYFKIKPKKGSNI